MDNPDAVTMKRDGQETLRLIVHAIASWADHRTMLSMPTHAGLAEVTGRSIGTIKRYVALLRKWGLLVTVINGRKARDGENGNIANVYALCVPAPLSTEPGEAVDNMPGVKDSPTESQGAQIRPQRAVEPARALQDRFPPLRRISTRYLRKLIRPYLADGWTASDIAHALDNKPDGTRWPHDGASGVRNVIAWFRFRLKAWKGHLSPSQRARQEQVTLAERAAQRRAREDQARAQAAPPTSSGRQRAKEIALACLNVRDRAVRVATA